MTNNLQTDIAEAIKQHLPAQVGDALRKRLEHADAIALRNDDLEKKLVELERKLLNASEFAKQAGDLGARETSVSARELAVKEAEIRREVFESKAELAAEKRVSDAMKTALLGLVRNTEYRNVLNGTTPIAIPGYSQNGCNYAPMAMAGSVNTQTDSTAD